MTSIADSMRCCLVTGADGFLGKSLVSMLLENQLFVRGLVRSEPAHVKTAIEIVGGELGSSNIAYNRLLNGIDTVFHLASAAHSGEDTAQYIADYEATLLLAREAERRGIQRFVFVSSTRAMSATGRKMRDETFMDWPNDSYGYWKRTTENKLLEEINIPHLAIVRPCLIYGAFVKGNLRMMIKAVESGYFPFLQSSGSIRSMVGVNDAAAAMLVAAIHPDANRQPLIVADGQPYTLREMHSKILAVLGKPTPKWSFPLWLLRGLGFIGDQLRVVWKRCPLTSDVVSKLVEPAEYSAEKIRALGWKPTTTFYNELPEVIATSLKQSAE